METLEFQIAQWGFALLSFIAIAAVLRGLALALKKTSFSTGKQSRIFWGVAIAVVFWLGFTGVLSYVEFFLDFSGVPPRMMFILLPPLVLILTLSFTKGTTEILRAVPPQWLLYSQVFRVPVEIFIWLMFVAGVAPVQMTFEGLNFDILAGIFGPVFAWLCFTGKRLSRKWAIFYNIASLALLANIVTIAILSFPTPMRVFMNEPANTVVARFPIVWLPAILVTWAYTMHILSLRQLLGKSA